MKKVARILRKHLDNILTYLDSYITNAFSEGINSKIQAIKANARGFSNLKNYRTRILFFCGKLSLAPSKSTKNLFFRVLSVYDIVKDGFKLGDYG
jgi:transposase